MSEFRSGHRRAKARCFVTVYSLDTCNSCWMCLLAGVLVGVTIPLHALWRWRNWIFAESGLALLNPAGLLRDKGLSLLPHRLSNFSKSTSGFSHLFQKFFVCLPASLKISGRTDFPYRLGAGPLGLAACLVNISSQQHPYTISIGTLLLNKVLTY